MQSKDWVLAAAIVISMSLQGCDPSEVVNQVKDYGKDLVNKGKDYVDHVAAAGDSLGGKNKDNIARAQKHLEEQTAELKSKFEWFEPMKRRLEDEIGANVEKLTALGKDGAEKATEKAKALKSMLVNVVLAAKSHGAESQKKVNAAADKVKETVDPMLAQAQNGVGDAGEWLKKMKSDMTGLVAQVREGFDANRDGEIDLTEYMEFANFFGVDANPRATDVNGDGKLTDAELNEALAHGIEEKLKTKGNNKHDEM